MSISGVSPLSSPSSPKRYDEEKDNIPKEIHKKINVPRGFNRQRNLLKARHIKTRSVAVNPEHVKESIQSLPNDPFLSFSANFPCERAGITNDLLSRHVIEIRDFHLKKNADKSNLHRSNALFQKKYFNKITLGEDVFLNDNSIDLMVAAFVKRALNIAIKGLSCNTLVLDQIDILCSEFAYKIFNRMTHSHFLERQLDRNMNFFLNCMWSSIRDSLKKTHLIEECFELTNILALEKQSYLELIAEVEKDKKKWILKSLLLAINPEEHIALNVVARIRFWNNLGIDEIRKMISLTLVQFITISNIPRRVFIPHSINEVAFSNDRIQPLHEVISVNDRIKSLLRNIDLEQVARSYLQNALNYKAIDINKVSVHVANLKGSEQERQNFFYQNFLEILYKEGLFGKEKVRGEIKAEIEEESKRSAKKFLKKEKNFLGCEILCIGSNSAWSLCDKVIRQLFPALFKSPFFRFSTRLQQGTECTIHITDPDTYSIEIKKNYCTYNLLYPEDHLSFVIEERELCSTEFLWSVYYKRKVWSMRIQILSLNRLKANDEEWSCIVEIINHYHYFENLEVRSRKHRKVSIEGFNAEI